MSATPDQIRAQEKRDAGKARADAAAKASAEQEWPGDPEPTERAAAPKGRKSTPKSEA